MSITHSLQKYIKKNKKQHKIEVRVSLPLVHGAVAIVATLS